MESNDVPAGWYDDPSNPGGLRLWDGTQWTEQVQVKPLQRAVPMPTPIAKSTGEEPIHYLPPAKEKRRSFIPVLLIILGVIICFGLIIWGATFFLPKAPEPTVFSAPTASAEETAGTSTIPQGEGLTGEQYRTSSFIQQVENQYLQVLGSPYVLLTETFTENDAVTTRTGYHENGYGRYVSTRQEGNGKPVVSVVIADELNNETCVRKVTQKTPDTVEADKEATWICGTYDATTGQDQYAMMKVFSSPLTLTDTLIATSQQISSVRGVADPLTLVTTVETEATSMGNEITYLFPEETTVVFSHDIVDLSQDRRVVSQSEITVSPTEQIMIVRSPDLPR